MQRERLADIGSVRTKCPVVTVVMKPSGRQAGRRARALWVAEPRAMHAQQLRLNIHRVRVVLSPPRIPLLLLSQAPIASQTSGNRWSGKKCWRVFPHSN